MPALHTREHGSSGPLVVLIHGGPGAPGYMAPIARALADSFRVLEPFQRGAGDQPLSVARHVADLNDLISLKGGERPAIVGHSWGAMLALAYAAEHPDGAAAIALIGCGTFDQTARDRMREIREGRMDDALRQRLAGLPEEVPDPDRRHKLFGRLLLPLHSHDPVTLDLEVEACDARAHQESWEDMLRLQNERVYPAAFTAIKSPVIMLHGAFDPHPGRLIRASLEPHLPQLEYHEWERCGHYPWLERSARDDFFLCLRQWLAARFT